MPNTKMKNTITKKRAKRMTGAAASLLRSDRGAMARIAKRVGVNKSTVTRVANGQRGSERTREAIIQECLRISKLHAHAGALIEITESALQDAAQR